MQKRLLCRGPDDRGDHVDGPCGLTHTRLAVLDPARGQQPMTLEADGGSFAVVFNGQIYNHRELRAQLERKGHRFRSDHSDTEVLLHGHREWGWKLPDRLEGMFAFALWDGARQRLMLCRDRLGQKPLYLRRDACGITFASTPAALIAGLETTPGIDRAALAHYLAFGYTDERSLLESVEELPAATVMTVTADGCAESRSYWSPPAVTRAGQAHGSERAVEQMIEHAVGTRLEADVPLGCFLSGGIDSSLIAAMAQRKLLAGGDRLRTFSVSMPDARYDEAPVARSVAEHLGTEHTELTAEPRVEDDLRFLIETMGEPTGDSSILPTHWLSKAARQHVTVALSGDGGDELFAGYERYRAMRLLRRHAWWLRAVPTGLFPHGEQKKFRSRMRRLLEAARYRDPADRYRSMISYFDGEQLRRLLSDGGEPMDGAGLPGRFDLDDPADAARRWDLTHYLPFDLLRKVDRASMAVGLEVRSPMLDTGVCELAAHLPATVLMPRGRLKGLLRRIAARCVPEEVTRRPKMGFAVPIGEWFRGELRPLLQQHLLDARHLPGIGVDRASLEELIGEHHAGRADHTHRLFALLTLSMWLQWLESECT